MTTKTVAPFGAWPSPVTTTWLTNAALRLSAAQAQGQRLFWVEGRPWEQGRMVVVAHDESGTRDWIPAPFGARTRVHEYGGGAYCVHGDDLWFCDDASEQVFHTRGDGHCRAITQPSDWRLADLQYDEKRQRLLAVGENHVGEGEPENALVSIDLASGKIAVLASGRSFFASPRLCAHGDQLAYLAWDHPHMPWDAAELWLCDVASDGALASTTHIAGDANASVFGPAWSPTGTLAFAWEAEGYWNIYTWSPHKGRQALTQGQTEFALPQWQFGMSTLGWCNEHTLVAAGTAAGRWQIYAFNSTDGSQRVLVNDLPALSHLHAQDDVIVAIGSAPHVPNAVVRVPLTGGYTLIKSSLQVTPEIKDSVAQPLAYDFTTNDKGAAHALFYPPFSATHEGPAREKPPLVVMAHSGPTAQTHPAFNPSIAYWTSRGFAVIDVNYRGSTGYGRAFRQQLQGQWGIVDVADCVAAAQQACARGWVDRARMAIRGSSAGGFTVLSALAFHNVFGAGATLYGVSDLEALARDTHKFESHYLDGLIGPYPAAASVYRERSPLHAAHAITAPVIFFQGLEDKVVPASQAQRMYEALLAKGITTKYVAFPDEGHGFRRAETIRRVFDEELAFYRTVFGMRS